MLQQLHPSQQGTFGLKHTPDAATHAALRNIQANQLKADLNGQSAAKRLAKR